MTLVDLEDGKTFHSHFELLRPLSLKQYKALLTKQWDFNNHFTKVAKSARVTRSAFDRAMDPITKEEILQSEGLLDMHDLFPDQPIPDTPHDLLAEGVAVHTDPPPAEPDGDPPDPPADQPDHETVDDFEFNSFRVSEEASKLYRKSLDSKSTTNPKKKISFSDRLLKYFK